MGLSDSEEKNLEVIIKAYPKLKIGQSMDEVKRLLGSPTSSRPIFSKSNRSTSTGTYFEYKVTSQSSMPNANDVLLSIIFDNNGLVIGAQPQNIPQLQPRGLSGN